MRLFLIRHGETEWSRTGQHTGVTDLPLTSVGEMMAAALQPYFANRQISQTFSSPRLRAQRTCALAGLMAPIILNDLAEWDYGDDEGVTSASIRQRRPDWEIFRDGCPNGESPTQVAARADRVIERLLAVPVSTTGGDSAVFSHGHFSRVLAARWIGMPLPLAAHLALDPAGVCILQQRENHDPPRVIETWNLTIA